jgi:hypothetical protein
MDYTGDEAKPREGWLSVRGIPTHVLHIGEHTKDDRAIVIIPGRMIINHQFSLDMKLI